MSDHTETDRLRVVIVDDETLARAVLRDPAHYYAYAPVFEGNHGRGLSGFAHVGRKRYSFQADRGLSLLAPAGLVDFVEIAQMGCIGVNVWYEFLNLGFRPTAMAGSDVPWGGTIGNTRVYAYTGKEFDADRWLDAVEAAVLSKAMDGKPVSNEESR